MYSKASYIVLDGYEFTKKKKKDLICSEHEVIGIL